MEGEGAGGTARLHALRATGLLDDGPPPELERLAALAADLLTAPIAAVTLVDERDSHPLVVVGAPRAASPLEQSFCRHVLDEDGPVVLADAREDPRTAPLLAVAEGPLRSYAGLPLRDPAGHLLGTFCVVDTRVRTWSERELVLLDALATAASAQVALALAAADARRSDEQLRLLARTSDLVASSDDPLKVLAEVARLLLEVLGGWCNVWLRQGDVLLPAAVFEERDGVVEAVPPIWPQLALDGPSVTARALRSGAPLHVPDVIGTMEREGRPADAHLKESRAAGVGEAYAVPVGAGDAAVGVLTVVRRSGRPPLTEQERALVRQVAERAGVVAAAVRRGSADRLTAEVLQQSMLPVLRRLDDVDHTARYRAGAAGVHVGGDLYDLLDLGAGRVGVCIGDVMGRGLHAAAVMGQLRTALRAYARLDLPPGQVLGLLDELVGELDGDPIATLLYGVLEADGTLVLAAAGHPQPLLRTAVGEVVELVGETGAPLGTGRPDHPEQRHRVGAGDVLCLFTDGLVEDRLLDVTTGTDRVARLLGSGGDDLEALADAMLATRDGAADDVALLLVRPVPASARPAEITALPAVQSARDVPVARHALRDCLDAWAVPAVVQGAVELVAAELLSNALSHGTPPASAVLRRTPTALHLEVREAGQRMRRQRAAGEQDEHGRGLTLVAAMCRRWGSRVTPDGKVVWAEFALSA